MAQGEAAQIVRDLSGQCGKCPSCWVAFNQIYPMKTLSLTYTLECKWPHSSWRCVPEHDGITLQRAQQIRRSYRRDWPKMRTRLVRTTIAIVS